MNYRKFKQLYNDYPWLLYPASALIILIIIAGISILLLSRDLPSLTQLEMAGDVQLVTKIYSSDEKVIDQLYRQNRIIVPIERIPNHLEQATIAIEDQNFYNHWGISLKRIAAAIIIDISSLSFQQGASTITQQLARKIYLHPNKTIIRKLKEQLTSLQIERTYSKSEILNMYLNRMPLGRGTHGVQAAALAYFGKNVEELEIQESAMLAGLFRLPYGYSPDRNPETTKRRRNIVLNCMYDCNFITEEQCDSLKKLDLKVIERDSEETSSFAPYFTEYIRQNLQQEYGMGLYTNGLSIYTTLDTRVQACADSAVKLFLPEFEQKYREKIIEKQKFKDWFDPPLETEQEIEEFLSDSALVDSLMELHATPQVALTAVNPSNGHILAMIGGRDFSKSKYNRATQMKRQPGSSFKPFAYTVAIDNGWPTTTELLNQPVVIIMPDGSTWRPTNYDKSTGGPTTLREGLRKSLNLIAAKLVQELIPPSKVVSYAKHFGFTTEIHPYDGVALGQDVVIPLELTVAYSVFANKGVRVEPTAILRVEDKDGNILEKNIPDQRVVICEETAYIMVDMLQTVINRGTGVTARTKWNFYRPAGGKTGTTNDFRNAWFAGFTPQIASSVWIGFDDQSTSLGNGQNGALTALPIWAPFMKMAHDSLHLAQKNFIKPDGVVNLKICNATKKIATSSCPKILDEIFLKELAPKDICDIH
ncbi:MAG: PBP1A family penicillin-binding protein [bacterium]